LEEEKKEKFYMTTNKATFEDCRIWHFPCGRNLVPELQ